MKLFRNSKYFIGLLATLSCLLPFVSSYDEVCDEETGLCSVSPYLNPTELLEVYPDILSDEPPENKNILCPFVRLVERYGLIGNDFMPDQVTFTKCLSAIRLLGTVPNAELTGFGVLISVSQTFQFLSWPGFVNMEALHKTAISHDCGFQFAKSATATDDEYRNSTLSKLADLADDDGHLSFDDIAEVKYAICEEQGVDEITYFGEGEMSLLYSFLGGAVRGYVEYSDVERFLYSKFPMMIGEIENIDFPEPSDA
eukprot:CAMPEP_0178956392 /NCGR_PEP_ID=MMETSP0789-20121207/10220_1 /TAXON_ID=3005 /ORGANISM="Rhizosolenia setigera, Strain CCMP 1694" /LENGTH=254 /DNA_ID=CAMNT_0020638299 /DNA_START=76 /DNA_END=840 /DNA_ORIENTATION=+